MDCNSYSYINYSGDTNNIKMVETADNNIIYLDFEENYFQDKYFCVSDLYGDVCECFEFSEIPLKCYKIDDKETAYKKAIDYFNNLVPDKDKIIIV